MSRPLLAVLAVALAGCPHAATTPAPAPAAASSSVAATPAPPPSPAPGGPLSPPQPTLRLPKNFVPTGYAARLDIDPAKTTFDGSIAITGTVSEPSAVIWLHGRHLTIKKASATRSNVEMNVAVAAKGEDLLEVRPERPLDAGEWTLMIDYAGELDTVSTTGAFKQVVGGNAYVYSQLEAIYARRVFPCVDEPDNKVPWKLTLDVPGKLVALANTNIASEAPIAGGKRRVEFAPTKPLPSYLVAFGVGPFEIVDAGKTKGGTPVRIITLAKRAAEGAYAAKTAAKVLEITEDWFGIPYPYEKLDFLSIPITVGFGAMENPGLITFTETLMLMDPKTASRARQNVWIYVSAHEIAHQWFGDLVTMAYWDDIWLNEGFANWMETKTAAKFDPASHDEGQALDQRNSALAADALVSARQIRQPIVGVDDILNAFDGITYNKGASVLRMFEAYVGPDVFQKGVRAYLQAHAYRNATSADFAAAISEAAGTDVSAAFATFLDQPGAPLITATTDCAAGAKVRLHQERYLPAGAGAPSTTTPWIMPVCVAYEAGGKRAEKCTMLSTTDGELALGGRSCPRWVMPNAHAAGYYRVAFTQAQVTSLRDDAWSQLDETERRALFNEVSTAVGQGKAPLMLALSFVPKMLAMNDRFTVPAAVALPTGYDAWIPTDLRAKYEYWLRTSFGAAAAAAGLLPKEDDSLDAESSRKALTSAVAWTARDPKLVEEAVALADKWHDLPQAQRSLVLDVAVDAKADFAAKIMRDVRTEPDRAHREEMYGALASQRDTARQLAALELILDPKLDIRETLGMIWQGAEEVNHDVARKFFADHKAAILDRLPKDGSTDPIADHANVFTATCRADQRDAVIAYVRKEFQPLAGGKRAVDEAIEGMNQCIAKRAVIEPELRGWLTGVKIAKPKPDDKQADKKRPDKKKRDPKEVPGSEKPPESRKKK